MKFKNFQLIIDSSNPTKDDMKKISEIGLNIDKTYGDYLYEVEKEFLEDRFLWLSCIYDNTKVYNENIINNETDEKEANPRSKSQVELRKQLFICYDLDKATLYINDLEKCGFAMHYIKNTLQKDVEIKKIFKSLEEFEKIIKTIKSVKYVQKDNLSNRMNDSLFNQERNIFGMDLPDKITISLDFNNRLIRNFKNISQTFKKGKDVGEFEDIVIVGFDDNDMEHKFDFNNMITSIEIDILKNENGMYDKNTIKTIFLNEIR